MKKTVISLATLFVLFSMFLIPTYADSFKVFVNGQKVNFQVNPVVQNGTTMVQIAPIFKSLKADYRWYQNSMEIVALRGDTMVEMKLGSKLIYINGVKKLLSVAPTANKGYTLVPLRLVSEAFGGTVSIKNGEIEIFIGEPVSKLGLSLNNIPENDNSEEVKLEATTTNIRTYLEKNYSSFLNSKYGGFTNEALFAVNEAGYKEFSVAMYYSNSSDAIRYLDILSDDLAAPKKISRAIADDLREKFKINTLILFIGTSFRGEFEASTASTIDYVEGKQINSFINSDGEFMVLP